MSERVRHEVTTRRVVYEIPGQDAVRVRRGLPYAGAGGEALSFDLYEPPGSDPRGPRPAVIFVTGYNDLGLRQFVGCKAKEMASYVTWGQLVAMGGVVGVTYEFHHAHQLSRWAARLRHHGPQPDVSGGGPVHPGLPADHAWRLNRTRWFRCSNESARVAGTMTRGPGFPSVRAACNNGGRGRHSSRVQKVGSSPMSVAGCWAANPRHISS